MICVVKIRCIEKNFCHHKFGIAYDEVLLIVKENRLL